VFWDEAWEWEWEWWEAWAEWMRERVSTAMVEGKTVLEGAEC